MSVFRKGLVYRLMPTRHWDIALASGFLPYNADDERDGFFHLSGPDQVMGTAARFYADCDELVCAGFAEKTLADDLKWEGASDHGVFPHYYGFVRTEWVQHKLAVNKQPSGQFDVVDNAEGA
ncbi:DUF952 domain-containing protein [Parvularcula sp. LCG005]|uniref:DUF952 domain-containing protein n=1 Tax=Parvularcula sp. LCG005 TaxID=3078805 RepID=UPI002943E27C|nr:DUF952 domain-containing protein [Parvularcula sp. LCG005]WOI53862.1 DUF952 domain-containing protein [Parvularcula sp. LCG005]